MASIPPASPFVIDGSGGLRISPIAPPVDGYYDTMTDPSAVNVFDISAGFLIDGKKYIIAPVPRSVITSSFLYLSTMVWSATSVTFTNLSLLKDLFLFTLTLKENIFKVI